MPIDKLMVGARIRKIREEMFEESRNEFAVRCNLAERYVGQVERGEFIPSLNALDKIKKSTGVDVDFILYGKNEKTKLNIRNNLHSIIDNANDDELKVYYKCITTIKGYINKDKN